MSECLDNFTWVPMQSFEYNFHTTRWTCGDRAAGPAPRPHAAQSDDVLAGVRGETLAWAASRCDRMTLSAQSGACASIASTIS